MRLTLREILEATGGRATGGTQVGNAFVSFHTDSREVKPGGVFFALRGAAKDGHDFVSDAIERGAGAVVVERSGAPHVGLAEILVEDTWAALYSAASLALDKAKPLVVAVTGSNGKTSTRELIAAILATRYQVHTTAGNLNTETGVPLTILALEPEHNALVLEMGMQRAGDIGRLTALARPRIGAVTNIGTVHMEFFATRADLARAKGELVAALPADGLAVLNADNEFYALLSTLTPARIASFGRENGEYRVENYRNLTGAGSRFSLKGVDVKLSLAGRHQALNAAAALAVGEGAGVPLAAGAAALTRVTVPHRLQDLPAAAGYTVVDDAYNASPESMIAAFDTLKARSRRGRLLAVLGPMGELGAEAGAAHREVGRLAKEVFDAVCVVAGNGSQELAEAAGAEIVADREGAIAWVRRHARKDDRVLIKGSHASGLEAVVDELKRR